MSFEIKEYRNKTADESCITATHSSGLKVYICEKPELNTSYAVFGTHYGSIDTEFTVPGGEKITVPEGIAHFLEHKMFECSDGDAFEKFSVTGASANAYTSFDRTCYLFSCSGKFNENLAILLDFVSEPYFTPETVKKEQGIIGQEIKMYEDVPDWRVLFNLLRILYHRHPVKIEIAGTVRSIAEITDKTLYDCYNTFYDPSNMFLCICGNVDKDKILRMVDEKIKPRKKQKIEHSDFDEPESIVKDYCEQKMAVSIPLFTIGIKDTVSVKERSVKQIIATELLLETVAGRISPLYDELLRKGLINNNFGSEYFYGYGYSALLFEGESRDPKAVKDKIAAEIRKIAENGVDRSLFEDARRNAYGFEIRSFDGVEDVVGEFIDCAMTGADPYEALETLKTITAEDIDERARELDLRKLALSVVK